MLVVNVMTILLLTTHRVQVEGSCQARLVVLRCHGKKIRLL